MRRSQAELQISWRLQMAGEWIPYDLALPTKPEVQELIDLTGEPVEVVVFRMLQLWGWASLNSDDGTVRATPARLGRTCGGGDDRFWLAVETVGWIRFDASGTAEIPGWGRRFSQSAKTRALHSDRATRARAECANVAPKRNKSARDECAQAQQKRTRGEEKTVSSSSSSEVDVAKDGETLRAAWNAAARAAPTRLQAYGGDELPLATMDRLAEAGWLQEALQAIERLPRCRYFATPVNLAQFSGRKAGVTFSRKVLEQAFDNPREQRGPGRLDDKPPPAAWAGDDAARFEATKAALAAKFREAV